MTLIKNVSSYSLRGGIKFIPPLKLDFFLERAKLSHKYDFWCCNLRYANLIITCFRLNVNKFFYLFYNICMYKRIVELRKERKLNQKQVAEYLGMSQTGYSKYETGENDIPTAVLIKLANLYKTTTDYILELTDEL